MLRVRVAVIVALLVWVIYALMPRERKRRLGQKLTELVRALAIAIVIYWIYMLFVFLSG